MKTKFIKKNLVMTSNTTPAPYVVTDTTKYNDDYAGWKALDGNDKTGFFSHKSNGGDLKYIQIDFGENQKLLGITMATGDFAINGMSSTSRGPGSFEIYGGDTSTPDILLEKFSGNNDWVLLEEKVFLFKEEYNYRYYRIKFTVPNTSVASNIFYSIGHLKFIEGLKKDVKPLSFAFMT